MAGRREISSGSRNEVQGSDFLKRLSVGCENEAIKITTQIVQVCRDEQSFAVIYWHNTEKKMFLLKGSLPVKQYNRKMQNSSYKHKRGMSASNSHSCSLFSIRMPFCGVVTISSLCTLLVSAGLAETSHYCPNKGLNKTTGIPCPEKHLYQN